MNGWLRDFFHKNAYSILLMIGGLIVMVTVMRVDVESVLKEIPNIRELEKKQFAQEEINSALKEQLNRIEDKLDRALRE